jgi:hypothetical protein
MRKTLSSCFRFVMVLSFPSFLFLPIPALSLPLFPPLLICRSSRLAEEKEAEEKRKRRG